MTQPPPRTPRRAESSRLDPDTPSLRPRAGPILVGQAFRIFLRETLARACSCSPRDACFSEHPHRQGGLHDRVGRASPCGTSLPLVALALGPPLRRSGASTSSSCTFVHATWGGLNLDFPSARYHRAHHVDPWDLRFVAMPLSAMFTGGAILLGRRRVASALPSWGAVHTCDAGLEHPAWP